MAAERTTLSVCDLCTGHRQVLGLPGVHLGTNERACFEWHFFEPSLVRRHDLQRSAPQGNDDQRIGLEYALAMLLFRDLRTWHFCTSTRARLSPRQVARRGYRLRPARQGSRCVKGR